MSKKPNIVLLHYSCPPVVGGVEEVLRQQAALFHLNGHAVSVIAGEGDIFSSDFPINIYPLLGSGNKEIKAAHGNPDENQDTIDDLTDRVLSFFMKTLGPEDILIAHNILSMPYNMPLTLALHRLADSRPHSRIIAWNHDSPYFYDPYPAYLDREPWTILRDYNPSIRYVTVSKARQDQFQELYGEDRPVLPVPNGIDPVSFFNLSPAIVNTVREMKLFGSDLLIAQPSRLHPRKNIEFSIGVIAALKALGVKARLLLTGAYDPHEETTRDYYKKLKALSRELKVESDILILADILQADPEDPSGGPVNIHDLYLISDVMLLPSLQEGFGIPLLEAGLFKLPIVCSDIAPFKEVSGGQVNLFSSEDTEEDVARMILDIVNTLPTNRMHRHVIKNYLWDNIYTSKILPLFQEIMAEE